MMEILIVKSSLTLFRVGVFIFLFNSLIAQSRDFVADASVLGNNPRFQDSPRFVQEPEASYYVIKKKIPVSITCKAINTARIKFKCAGQWIEPMSLQNQIDTTTNRKILAATLQVEKDDVDEYFGGAVYWCECYGYQSLSGQDDDYNIKSKRGEIKVAYLRRDFERNPMPVRVGVSHHAVLQCLPPDGNPLPEVYWLKDGVEIDVKNEKNYIISHAGDLLINQAQLSNMGNYTCGARNGVNKRRSDTAALTVYVDGAWSSWSKWSDCSTKCGKGFQRRHRTCTNPAPINDGQPCPGEKQQRLDCSNLCPVDGGWTEWTSWSTCSPDCVHHRTRSCERPAPKEGGSYCRGSDLNGANCTGGMCRDKRLYTYPQKGGTDPSKEVTRSEEQGKDNIILYIGLCVGIVVFGIVVVVFVLIIRRSTMRHHDSGGISSPEEEKMNKNSTDLCSVPPDLTQQVVTVPQHSNSPSPSVDLPNNNYAPFENIYDKPDFNISSPESRHSFIKNGNTVVVEPSINLNRSVSDMNSQDARNLQIASPGGMISPHLIPTNENLANSRQSMTSVQLPSNIETEAVTWGTFNHLGGRLVLPESGVSLTVPEGAVKKGGLEEIFLGICRDDKDRPKLSDRQTIVSPVIVCGPNLPGMLKKPIILSFQHCANMRQGGWMLTLCNSDAPPEDPPQWKRTVTLGQETINTQVYTQLDPNQCHVMTDTLSWYTLIGEAVPNGRPVKILRLAAFAATTPPSMDFSIRVYVVEDTQDALEGVVQEERKFGGRLLDKPKQIPFQDGGHNLILTIEDLSPGWRSKLAANFQEIPFQHIWSGNQNSLHCSFSLELVDRSIQNVSCNIQVYQKAILSNRQVLHVQSYYKEKLPSCSTPSSTLKGRSSTVTTNSSSGFSSMVALDHHTTTNFRLPPHIRNQLCLLLDPPNARGNDWRMLAQALTVDRYVQYFATKNSPTEHILNLWEARHREESAVTDLMNILRVMGRMDAAAVMEKDIGSWL